MCTSNPKDSYDSRGGLPLTAVCLCYDSEGTISANFSETKGRVFKRCATKGRILNTKCEPDSVWFFPVVVPGKVQNVKKMQLDVEVSPPANAS